MEKYTMFMDRKNQYSENEYTTQSNLQIQCNPYQATSFYFQNSGRWIIEDPAVIYVGECFAYVLL